MRYRTNAYTLFAICNYLLLAILAILSLIPIVHTLAVSLSSRGPADAHLVSFLPIGFTLEPYIKTLTNQRFGLSLLNGFTRTALGTLVSMLVITPAAFALSKSEDQFRGRNLYMWFFIFAMLFSGGLIPSYIVVVKTKLINSIWSLILPAAVNIWNMILLMNFFRVNVPKALEEAALLDGASYFTILTKIYLPLSTPALATIALFTMVFHWNSWFDGLIYLNDPEKYPLATFLQTILVQENISTLKYVQDIQNLTTRTVKAAQVFISMIPVLLVYPYLQKFFVKGLVLGAIKE